MEDRNLDERLAVVEAGADNGNQDEAYDIYVKNGISGNKVSFYAAPDNWLIQIFEGTAKDIGLNPQNSTNIYFNENGQSTSDSEMSLGEFGIGPGSVLTIQQDGKVAAD